jgi:hypothetical protein
VLDVMRCHLAPRAEAIEDETPLLQGKNAIVYGAGGSSAGWRHAPSHTKGDGVPGRPLGRTTRRVGEQIADEGVVITGTFVNVTGGMFTS